MRIKIYLGYKQAVVRENKFLDLAFFPLGSDFLRETSKFRECFLWFRMKTTRKKKKQQTEKY